MFATILALALTPGNPALDNLLPPAPTPTPTVLAWTGHAWTGHGKPPLYEPAQLVFDTDANPGAVYTFKVGGLHLEANTVYPVLINAPKTVDVELIWLDGQHERVTKFKITLTPGQRTIKEVEIRALPIATPT